jgi:hypothetical protein
MAKQSKVAFSNYANAVTLICSVEAWLEECWGPSGKEGPGQLTEFDRFPNVDGLTPDFVAVFKTPYVLCGEHKTTFPDGPGSQEDVRQIIAYSRWKPNAGKAGAAATCDVMLLVGTHSDDIAARHIHAASEGADPDLHPVAPIVILGFYPQVDRVQGDWYDLKWRQMPGNSRFSDPNVTTDRTRKDLNQLIADATHYAIKVDRAALDLTGRNPFINDNPPALYTCVRVLFPALTELLTEDEKDALRLSGRVEKAVSRQDILRVQNLASVSPPERYIQEALKLLVDMKIARPVRDSDPPTYTIKLDIEALRDLREVLPEKEARAILSRMKLRRRPRKQRMVRGQLPLPGFQER